MACDGTDTLSHLISVKHLCFFSGDGGGFGAGRFGDAIYKRKWKWKEERGWERRNRPGMTSESLGDLNRKKLRG